MLSVNLPNIRLFLWKDRNRMCGAVVLIIWMFHLDDWNEVLMDRLGKFLWIVKITHFKESGKIININIHFLHHNSLHVFIFSQTNRKNALTDMDGIVMLSSVSKVYISVTWTKINPENIKIFTCYIGNRWLCIAINHSGLSAFVIDLLLI